MFLALPVDLEQNYILIQETYQQLKKKKQLYLLNKKEDKPTPFQILSKEDKLRVILERLKEEKGIELDRKIAFNFLLRKHKQKKKEYWKKKNSKFKSSLKYLFIESSN